MPFVLDNGRPQVMIITSRETGRWIIPKGWLKKDMDAHELAAVEAYEEAGLRGIISEKPVGQYRYLKRLDDGQDIKCDVIVFPLLVETHALDWPEKPERKYLWTRPNKAAKLVDDDGLADLLRGFTPKKSLLWAIA